MNQPTFQSALIVGAGAGLSGSLARLFARHGLRVALAARQPDRVAELASEIGGETFACDVSEADQVAALFEQAEASIGEPDLVVFNPSATVAGLSQYLWKLEQPAHAVANGYYVGAINRVGTEAPWNIGKFYGTSYFVDPRGQFVAEGSEDDDELVVADLDLSTIDEVRKTWQFYRDRRPEAYDELVEQ